MAVRLMFRSPRAASVDLVERIVDVVFVLVRRGRPSFSAKFGCPPGRSPIGYDRARWDSVMVCQRRSTVRLKRS